MNFIKLNKNTIFHESGIVFIFLQDGEKAIIDGMGQLFWKNQYPIYDKEAWDKLNQLADMCARPRYQFSETA